jgi:uracil DNA glycosylase
VAAKLTVEVAPRATDATTHDLGFVFMPSHLVAAAVTRDEQWHAPAILAAHTLKSRFVTNGGYLLGSKPFSRANAELARRGEPPIDWRLDR